MLKSESFSCIDKPSILFSTQLVNVRESLFHIGPESCYQIYYVFQIQTVWESNMLSQIPIMLVHRNISPHVGMSPQSSLFSVITVCLEDKEWPKRLGSNPRLYALEVCLLLWDQWRSSRITVNFFKNINEYNNAKQFLQPTNENAF